ncbi:MAG TPA: hypothetical protein VK659_24920 [Asanoa sp.]|nr:hypothetical protein [Asanoa sp.]
MVSALFVVVLDCLLTARSAIVRSAVEAGTLRVVGARYDLDTAAVTVV